MKASKVALAPSNLFSSFDTIIVIPSSIKIPYPPISLRIFVVLPLIVDESFVLRHHDFQEAVHFDSTRGLVNPPDPEVCRCGVRQKSPQRW